VLDTSSRRSNTTLISHIDCPGGGQVWVEGTTLYVGHMRPTSGTTIVDVADPRAPRIIAQLPVREGWHSHKVRVAGGIMLVNQEKFGKPSPNEIGGGLNIYNVANPSKPKLIAEWRTIGGGVHRFDFDGRYAYISPTAEGYIGNIVMILDLADPAKPVTGTTASSFSTFPICRSRRSFRTTIRACRSRIRPTRASSCPPR
jgi:hypothetical protein